MRLPLLAAAVLAAGATALPAEAALQPVCAVALVADAVGTSARCSTNNVASPAFWSYRTFEVRVAAGTVDATLTCNGSTVAARVAAGETAVLRRSVQSSDYCTSTLTAVTANPKATGVTAFTPRFFAG